MKVGEFFIELGLHGAGNALSSVRNLVKAFGDLPVEAAAAIVAIGGIEYGLAKLANKAVETAVGLKAFTSQTGLSGQELQKWQGVAEQANVSAEAMASSVSALEKNLAAIRLGQGNIAPFQMFGIGVNQNAFSVLNQLRDRIKGMNPAMATNLISQMGLSPEMIQILQLSNKEFERMAKNYRGLSVEQEATFLRAKQALVEFNLKLRQTAFDHIEVFIRSMEKLWDLFSRFQSELPVILGALSLIAAYFLPITAAVTGLVLVLDDLATYFAGGDSLIGRAFGPYKKGSWKDAIDVLSSKNPASHGIEDLIKQMPVLFPHVKAASEAVGKGVGNVFNIVVNGTANAEHMAEEVISRIKKHIGNAELQLNNQGH